MWLRQQKACPERPCTDQTTTLLAGVARWVHARASQHPWLKAGRGRVVSSLCFCFIISSMSFLNRPAILSMGSAEKGSSMMILHMSPDLSKVHPHTQRSHRWRMPAWLVHAFRQYIENYRCHKEINSPAVHPSWEHMDGPASSILSQHQG